MLKMTNDYHLHKHKTEVLYTITSVNSVQVKTATVQYQPLLQFINATDVCGRHVSKQLPLSDRLSYGLIGDHMS